MIDRGRAEQRHDERRDARAMRDQVPANAGDQPVTAGWQQPVTAGWSRGLSENLTPCLGGVGRLGR